MLTEAGFSGLVLLNEVNENFLSWIERFDSGRDKLNDYLKSRARDQHDDHLGTTSLLFHEAFDGVVGYITLANDCVQLTTFEEGELGLRDQYQLRTFPAVKICRLAVNSALQRQGIGELIIDLAVGHIIESQKFCAARLLVTDALNEPAVLQFYKKLGFFDSGWADNEAKRRASHNCARGRSSATPSKCCGIFTKPSLPAISPAACAARGSPAGPDSA